MAMFLGFQNIDHTIFVYGQTALGDFEKGRNERNGVGLIRFQSVDE